MTKLIINKVLVKINYLFVCMLFFILIHNSCGDKNDCAKNGCPPEYTRYKLGEALPYLWAKPGSYWIYKHSQTGQLDTFVVTDFLFDTITVKGTEDHSKHITFAYDLLERVVYSSFNKKYYHDVISKYFPNATPKKGLFFSFHREGPNGDVSMFHYPFSKSENSGTGAETTTFVEIDSLYILEGKIYTNVAKFDISLDIYNENDCFVYSQASYYWAKDIGLIKRELKHCNFSWELIDYKINR